MNDITARTLSTVAIWIATAVILTFGVFGRGWTGMWAVTGLAYEGVTAVNLTFTNSSGIEDDRE